MPACALRILSFLTLLSVVFFSYRTAVAAAPAPEEARREQPAYAIVAEKSSVGGQVTEDIPVVNAGDGKKPVGMSDSDALKLLRDRLAEILEVADSRTTFVRIVFKWHGKPEGTAWIDNLTCGDKGSSPAAGRRRLLTYGRIQRG